MTQRALAIGLVVAFLFLAFVLRVALHRARRGDWGIHGLTSKAGSPGWWGGVAFGLSVLLTPLSLWLGRVDTLPGVAEAGVVLAVGGLGLTLLAQASMGASWRIGVRVAERTTLVTSGPFAWVRNPIFSGMLVFATGLVLLWPNAASLAAAAALFAAIELQVRFVEEPHLEATHAEAWRTWAARVGRFVPLVGRR